MTLCQTLLCETVKSHGREDVLHWWRIDEQYADRTQTQHHILRRRTPEREPKAQTTRQSDLSSLSLLLPLSFSRVLDLLHSLCILCRPTCQPASKPPDAKLSLPPFPSSANYTVQCTGVPRKCTPLGPYRRPMPRVLKRSWGGGCLLLGEVPLQAPWGVLLADLQ